MKQAVLNTSLPRCEHVASGKVREVYRAGEGLLIVSTDRVSAFDVIMNQGIPGRGIVLTRLSQFWFDRFADLCPHHLISTDIDAMPEEVRDDADNLRGRTMYVREVEIVPVECVVRGYLAGSGWKEYGESGTVCGVALPGGLKNSDKLPEPIFTPTTKASEGHDMPMNYAEVEELIGASLAADLRKKSLEIYAAGAAYAAERGILLADTKFEFGLRDGVLTLADEVLTPDSSRYWDAATYEPGRSQDSFDKQIVRDWLETTDWNKEPPPPTLPTEIIEKALGRYNEIADRLMA
ncbi:MAG: phosphoribosylaminoimidazolesuccinocarboxamide synthase [Planctomycetota bacterium]|jgi:phosphoribosylaminoimidazole-succinocarboxamide synthase